jgi:hypothetical protein
VNGVGGGSLTTAILLRSFDVAELWRRPSNPRLESTRKSIHVGGGLACLSRPFVIESSWVAVLIAITIASLIGFGRQLGFSCVAQAVGGRVPNYLLWLSTSCLSRLIVSHGNMQSACSLWPFWMGLPLRPASSPLQYLKRIRLDRARRLMAHDGYNASTAVRTVGYESQSQFSWEFKRLFSMTPVEEATSRTRLVAS